MAAGMPDNVSMIVAILLLMERSCVNSQNIIIVVTLREDCSVSGENNTYRV